MKAVYLVNKLQKSRNSTYLSPPLIPNKIFYLYMCNVKHSKYWVVQKKVIKKRILNITNYNVDEKTNANVLKYLKIKISESC